MKRNILLVAIFVFAALLCSEMILRSMGMHPYIKMKYSIYSTPKNRYLPASVFGSRLAEGKFKVVINNGLIYKCRFHRCNLYKPAI